MTATNHALTGAFIGLALGNPWVAVPVALASHFMLDALPHFGQERGNVKWLRSKWFKRILVADITLCFVIAGTIFTVHPNHWLTAIICAFIATSPDFYWIGKFKDAIAHRNPKRLRGFGYFAAVIQWFQKPIGAVVEAAWLVAMLVLLIPFLH